MKKIAAWLLAFACCVPASLRAQPFRLPTANQALFDPDGAEKFFAGTTGQPWKTGTFGCVRTEGRQMHEGLDIKSIQRDRRGEPTDPVMATADATVAYINHRPGLSNYGNYVVLKHVIDGLEIYSVYAHLSAVRENLRVGTTVKAGEVIATMGRTSNTRERISKERAHVHFELNLIYNEHYSEWVQKMDPAQRNDHGNWNGQNLAGLDARLILLAQREQGEKFRLSQWLQSRPELCRIFIRRKTLAWLQHYPGLIRRNPAAEKNGTAGYEISLDYNGAPIQITPRSESEIPFRTEGTAPRLLSVSDAEQEKNPCRKLVSKRTGQWQLTPHALQLLDLLAFPR